MLNRKSLRTAFILCVCRTVGRNGVSENRQGKALTSPPIVHRLSWAHNWGRHLLSSKDQRSAPRAAWTAGPATNRPMSWVLISMCCRRRQAHTAPSPRNTAPTCTTTSCSHCVNTSNTVARHERLAPRSMTRTITTRQSMTSTRIHVRKGKWAQSNNFMRSESWLFHFNLISYAFLYQCSIFVLFNQQPFKR